MSVAHEAINHMSMATAAANGAPPTYMIYVGAAVGAATGLHYAKKLTPHWHHTINDGEVGVWLKRGSAQLLPGISLEDVRTAEAEDPFNSVRHYDVVVADELTERSKLLRHMPGGAYRHKGGWRFVAPFRTLQTVYTAEQTSEIVFPLDSFDEDKQKMEITANLTWRIRPDGDHPVRAITRMKHIKTDKKDPESKDAENREEKKEDPIEAQVRRVGRTGMTQVLSQRTTARLYELLYLGRDEDEKRRFDAARNEMQASTVAACADRLIHYGAELLIVELMSVVRADAEVQSQALRTLSPRAAAVGASTNGHLNSEFILDERDENVPHLKQVEANGAA